MGFLAYLEVKKDANRGSFAQRYGTVVLTEIWKNYKRNDIQEDGRTVDRSQNFLTTSEGQSYSLLRAVWVDDKEVFDRVLNWTENNLQKRGDNLFSWKWGQRVDGSWGVLDEEGGLNTASDADLDIALALIMANKRWNDPAYLEEALEILDDVWNSEIVFIQQRPYLVAGNWATEEDRPTLNPSYYNFAAYNIFSEVDPPHDWMAVKETSYEVLNKSTYLLPPDWISIDRETTDLYLVEINGRSNGFSDDAIRIPWRVGLDWEWHRDPRALDYLNKLTFLSGEWESNGAIFRSYDREGNVLDSTESLSTYGAVLPYFQIVMPDQAEEIYVEKLASAYNPDELDFSDNNGYYSKNWGWFGMAFYNDRLVNLYQNWKEAYER